MSALGRRLRRLRRWRFFLLYVGVLVESSLGAVLLHNSASNGGVIFEWGAREERGGGKQSRPSSDESSESAS